MQLLFSSHAVDRMSQRKIVSNEVESVVRTPDGSIQQSQDKMIYYKKLKGRTDNKMAIVIVDKADKSKEVITVMNHFQVKQSNKRQRKHEK